MVHRKPIQKFISFTDNSPESEAVKEDMESGWSIVSLVKTEFIMLVLWKKMSKKVLMNQNHFLFPLEKN